jgi:hypothetical protein
VDQLNKMEMKMSASEEQLKNDICAEKKEKSRAKKK